jgi:hypothetical protein
MNIRSWLWNWDLWPESTRPSKDSDNKQKDGK